MAVQDKCFDRYERTGAAKPAHQHRSGSWSRSLRTLWGESEIRIPKLRKGNKKRTWQVLERYERNFGPWLDLQLHLYRLGLSQYDLQEILHLGFGQVLSLKAVQHLTDVAEKEMESPVLSIQDRVEGQGVVIELSPLAQVLFDSLGERMYNLAKKVHRLPLKLGLASRHSTTQWGNWAWV